MSNQERQQEIMTVMRSKKQASPQELSQLLHSSLSTIRRDLLQLEKAGDIKRSYGSVTLNSSAHDEPLYQQRQRQNRLAKQHIAEVASDFIRSGQTLFLDSSTSVNCLVPFLQKIPDLVIITNGLATAAQLNDVANSRVFLVGGELAPRLGAVNGRLAESFIESFTVDLAFFSCRGMDASFAYDANHHQAQFKQQVMNCSQQSILLCDSTKFATRYFYKLAVLTDFSAVITNQAPVDTHYLTASESQPEFYW